MTLGLHYQDIGGWNEMAGPDFASLLEKYDKSDMIGFTRNFIQDLNVAFSRDLELEIDRDWSGILCLGMGGSAAGGMFLSSLAENSGGLPFVVWQDYGLPSWWGPDWLILATSYSGNTEETLNGVRTALEEGGIVIGISSGGELEEILSDSEEGLCLSIPSGQMPRSAFGHIFGTQLAVCWSLGILSRPSDESLENMNNRLLSASKSADIIEGDGRLSSMVEGMKSQGIGIVSAGEMKSAGIRLANQINENSERFARPVTLPEMNHNEIVPWARHAESQSLIYLASPFTNNRTVSRIEWMMKNIEVTNSWLVECEGESLLESLLYAAHISDWISIALALINEIDPSQMDAIIGLKDYLSKV